MNYGQIAIFDSNSDYANSLADFFRLKGCISSQIVVFTKLDSFKEYTQKQAFDILLINYEFLSDIDIRTDSSPQNLFILCEQRAYVKHDDSMYLFKYSSADDILRQVMTGYKPSFNGFNISFCNNRNCNIIGIYSPVNRCGKTSFSLALALYYSLNSSCVFMSFDNFSTLNGLVFDEPDSNKTIDDLLYYYTGNPDILDSKLLSVVKRILQLDVIPSSKQNCTISDMSISERVQFIKSIADTGRYDYMFVDIGSVSPAHPIFNICKKVYIPAPLNDKYSDKKINMFMASLDNLNSEGRVPIKRVTPPVVDFSNQGSEYLYSLTSGDMKQFIVSLTESIDI